MDHQKDDYALRQAEGSPAILAFVGIGNADLPRVLKDEGCQFEADVMLGLVPAAFALVPNEAHGCPAFVYVQL